VRLDPSTSLLLGKVQFYGVEVIIVVRNALGETMSLRLLPRLKLSRGIVRCPKIWMTWGSRYASFESDNAFLIEGNIALISGLYVTTKGVPIGALSCRPSPAFVMLLRMACRDGIASNAFAMRTLE
jgi:hypothetical protein